MDRLRLSHLLLLLACAGLCCAGAGGNFLGCLPCTMLLRGAYASVNQTVGNGASAPALVDGVLRRLLYLDTKGKDLDFLMCDDPYYYLLMLELNDLYS